MCNRLSLHDQVPYSREIAQTQCSRPYDTLTCYLHTAIWLGKCQSILSQTQHSSELDRFSCRVSPFCTSTCLPVGPLLLGWPLAPPGRLIHPGFSLSQEDTSWNRSGSAPLGPTKLRRRRDVLQPPEVLRDDLAGNTCAHVPDRALDAFLGIREGSSALLLPRNAPGNGNMLILHALPETTTSFVFKKNMGRMNSYRLCRSLSPNAVCMV